MHARRLWVAQLHIDPEVAAKLRNKHSLEPDEVREAIECVERLPYVWDVDPIHGGRYIVKPTLRGEELLAALVPDWRDPFGDSYLLRTAYRIHK